MNRTNIRVLILLGVLSAGAWVSGTPWLQHARAGVNAIPVWLNDDPNTAPDPNLPPELGLSAVPLVRLNDPPVDPNDPNAPPTPLPPEKI